MALRNFLVLYPGLPRPDQFRADATPPLLTQQDLWREVRSCGPSLVFRVQSEQRGAEGDRMQPTDHVESCVGLVDSSTRWRTAFRMAATIVQAVRHPPLEQALQNALQFTVGSHPASVPPLQRQRVANELMRTATAEATDAVPAALQHEQLIAQGLANLLQADNDYDASYMTPFEVLCPFSEEKSPALYESRQYALETYSGAVLLDQAFNRLMERMPAWAFVKMPEISPSDQE
jgi:hypothetical protein